MMQSVVYENCVGDWDKKLFFSKKVKDDFYLMEVKANGFEL